MESRHTPGPWTSNPGGVFCGRGTICAISVGGSTGNDPNAAAVGMQALANMRLIAAAPDLLAACKACVADNWGQPKGVNVPALDPIRAAIAKAEGGGE